MKLTEQISKNNFNAYLWHAVFLALAQNFMDIDTIIPAMLIDAGGTPFHIGLLTAIMLGGASFAQIFFSPYLSNKSRKKKHLIIGIKARILSLFGLGLLLYYYVQEGNQGNIILLIFLLISVFSLSGAFAAISYTDILGKSLLENKRKSFFSLRQTMVSIGVFISAIFAAKLLAAFAYPINYAWLFIVAGGSLTIASLGFWRINEVAVEGIRVSGIKSYLEIILNEVRTNKKLVNYLLLVNSLGISLSLLPFLLLYSKNTYLIGDEQVGYYLLFKVLAGVITGAILFYSARKIKYNSLLYTIAALSVIIPLAVMLFDKGSLFGVYFFAGGIVYTLYKVAMEGVLLEVSTNQNRTIYTGLAGAGSLLPAVFPILAGVMIQNYGFNVFFIIYILVIAFSFYLIPRLDCQK